MNLQMFVKKMYANKTFVSKKKTIFTYNVKHYKLDSNLRRLHHVKQRRNAIIKYWFLSKIPKNKLQ